MNCVKGFWTHDGHLFVASHTALLHRKLCLFLKSLFGWISLVVGTLGIVLDSECCGTRGSEEASFRAASSRSGSSSRLGATFFSSNTLSGRDQNT